MENLTHTLVGVALSQAGLKRLTPYATLSLIIGANLPDIDVVARMESTATYLKYHRGITHSFVGVTVLGLALAVAVWGAVHLAAKIRRRPPPNLKILPLFLVCWVGTAGHLLLDFTNSYGVRPFLPFSGRWIAWDVMYVFDPILLLALFGGLILPALFRLISEEVGAKKSERRWGAVAVLVFLIAWWGLRVVTHRRALEMLEDQSSYGPETVISRGVFPSPANPFFWNGIVETRAAFYSVPLNLLDSGSTGTLRVFRKRPPQGKLIPVFAAAEKTQTFQIFSDFARYPWSVGFNDPEGFTVEVRDLRFLPATRDRQGFIITIELDRNLAVVREEFAFDSQPLPSMGGSRRRWIR